MAFAQPVVPVAPPLVAQLDDHGAGTVGVVGGHLSQLLEQNYAILNQFKQNMEVYKVNENTELLVRFRDNILTVLHQMNAMQVNLACKALRSLLQLHSPHYALQWCYPSGHAWITCFCARHS